MLGGDHLLQLGIAEVVQIVEQHSTIQYLQIKILESGEVEQAYFLSDQSTQCSVGDLVMINTTAVSLGLGTGGYHIVISKLTDHKTQDLFPNKWGHIMKLRYTPMQVAVDTIEEQNSPYHSVFADQKANLSHTPVLIGELHSLLPIVALSLHQLNPSLKLVYVMPDGASLPIAISKHVQHLKELEIISSTITVGHAWGGDGEAVNIYTGMLAAHEVYEADVILCMLGPGVVGTGTALGFSGVQLADIIHAVSILRGIPIVIPRIGFADSRPTHLGLSHHTLTLLDRLTLCPVLLPLPLFQDWRDSFIKKQLEGINRHYPVYSIAPSISIVEQLQKKYPEPITTMGRDLHQDASPFQTGYVAACLASASLSYLKRFNSALQPDQDVLAILAKLWDGKTNCEELPEFPMLYRPIETDES